MSQSEPDWLRNLSTLNQIKQALVQQSSAGTPLRQLDLQAKQILANREVQATLAAIRQLGVSVEYVALDVRDPGSVQRTFEQLQRQFGPVRGLIHGAGVLEDRRIEDKTREQFEHVFATKITGLKNLFTAIQPDQLKFLAVFSSYTARYGRVGQVDYAMANEALNKLARRFQQQHPACRVRSFNWGPWDGGMVTDSLKPLFAKEGVGLIPLEAGARLLVNELERTENAAVEVLVLAENSGQNSGQRIADSGRPAENKSEIPQPSTLNSQLSAAVLAVVAEKTGYPVEMLTPEMSLDHDLGIDSIKRVEILSALQERHPDLPTVKPEQLGTLHRLSDVIAMLNCEQNSGQPEPSSGQGTGSSGQAELDKSEIRNPKSEIHVTTTRCGWERTMDVAGHPYLKSHVIGGKAVVPTAMMFEILAHAAMHHHPGMEFGGLDQLRIFKGIRLGATDRISLRALTDKATRQGPEFRVPVRLVSTENSREMLHAQAEIVLCGQRPASPVARLFRANPASVAMPANWYETQLFHGPDLQGLLEISALNSHGIVVQARSATPPANWIADPWRAAWIADPLVIDVVLQALIVWTQSNFQRASLPTSIAGYRQSRRSYPMQGVQIAIQANRRNDATVWADAEILDQTGDVIATLSGIEYVLDAQLNDAFRKNRLL